MMEREKELGDLLTNLREYESYNELMSILYNDNRMPYVICLSKGMVKIATKKDDGKNVVVLSNESNWIIQEIMTAPRVDHGRKEGRSEKRSYSFGKGFLERDKSMDKPLRSCLNIIRNNCRYHEERMKGVGKERIQEIRSRISKAIRSIDRDS